MSCLRFIVKTTNIIKYPKNVATIEKLLRKSFYCTTPSYEINLQIQGTSLNKYIENLKEEFETLCKTSNYNSNSRWLELTPIIQILNERQKVIENIINLKDLLVDPDKELSKLAEIEKSQLENVVNELNKKLVDAIIPVDKEDSYDSLVLEIQAGVGGQEAMLFAKELFDMYCNFAEYKGWELEVADYSATDIGGLRTGVVLIHGKSVVRYLKYEAGVHRVQRTPTTEKSGRIHTSTASVLTLPQPTDIDVNIQQKDLRIETKRSSGAGGQHVNKTESAVRIVHLPTGIAVECQVDRSQIKNRKMAMARLTALLYQKELDIQTEQIKNTRKSQVRTRNRNEKIRTYNFNQDRITDHRLGVNVHNLEVFMKGGEPLEQLIRQLDEHHRIENLLYIVNNCK